MSHPLEEHVASVYRFALRLTGDPHHAEDLTQETFLRAWRRFDRLRDPRACRVWLCRIASNLWRDGARRRPPLSRADVDPQDLAAPEARLPVEENEEVARVLRALESLPPVQRAVLHLHAFEDLSREEIAGILHMSRNAVRANLSYARKEMRRRLKDLLSEIE